MHPAEFPQVNKRLGAPKGCEGEVGALPVCTDGNVCVSCWELTPEELEIVKRTGKIFLFVFSGETQPPVALVGAEDMPTAAAELARGMQQGEPEEAEVYRQEVCVFNYCPDPDTCRACGGCQHPMQGSEHED